MRPEVSNESVIEALNANLDYCNDLSERLIVLAQAVLNLNKKIRALEKDKDKKI